MAARSSRACSVEPRQAPERGGAACGRGLSRWPENTYIFARGLARDSFLFPRKSAVADMTPGRALRQAVADTTLAIPGAFNALVARMIEDAGFEAAYLSGAAFSAGDLALPDIGLFTLTELVEQTKRLSRSIGIPLIVDADTGFGEAVNVERTVIELEAAGAAAIQLEDQQLPKRCGHLSGKTLIEAEAMCAKLRAAVAAKSDADLVIVARTDARGAEGFDAAIERAKRYLDAGADWI